MIDAFTHKEYKLPNGRTVTADFDDLGRAMVTIQAMDALFDIINTARSTESMTIAAMRLSGNRNS